MRGGELKDMKLHSGKVVMPAGALTAQACKISLDFRATLSEKPSADNPRRERTEIESLEISCGPKPTDMAKAMERLAARLRSLDQGQRETRSPLDVLQRAAHLLREALRPGVDLKNGSQLVIEVSEMLDEYLGRVGS